MREFVNITLADKIDLHIDSIVVSIGFWSVNL